MRRTAALFVLLFLVSPSTTAAQHWNAQEQGLIDHIKMCWTAWVDAQSDPGPNRFFQACPYAEDASMWWTDSGALQTPERIRREWPFTAGVDLGWIDLEPMAIRIWGDIGMVQFLGIWKARTPDGPVTTEYKRTEIYRRVEDGWVFLGGQGTPATARDAEPYG